jgi:nucleotide-binding universal stress UspA family protein
MNVQRILVPVDFSDNALLAKAAAESLAERFGAEIQLLHVVEGSPYEVYVQKGFESDVPFYVPISESPPSASQNIIVKNLMEEAQRRLEQMSDKKAKIKSAVRRGNSVDEILGEIATYKADLVVMCTHGWRGIKHALLGSVTEKVVRLSPVPVLTVRAKKT